MLQFWSTTWRFLWQRFACPFIGACLLLGGPLLAQPSAPPQPDILTPQERAWLAAHPIIRLWPDPQYQPIDFLDKQGQHQGLSAEYLALIAQRLGLHYQVTRINPLHKKLDLKRPEAILGDFNTALTPTPSRNENWAFTKPYLEFPAYFIARNTAREGLTPEMLAGSRVAVSEDYAAREYLATKYPQLSLDLVPDTQTGLRKVSFGLVDVFVSDLPAATYWMEREGISNLKIVGETGYVHQLCLAARKDWPEFISILDKGLATITPEERVAIYQKWIKMPIGPGLKQRQWLTALFLGLGLAGIGLAGVLWWNRTLAIQVKKRTAELEREAREHEANKQALQESEERLRTIIEATPECIKLIDHEGTVLSLNAAGLKIIGARNISEVQGHSVYQLIVPEQQAGFRAFNERICAGEHGSFDFEIIGLDKVRRQLETFAVPIYDKKLGKRLQLAITRDVTERTRTEEALRQSEAMFRSLTETTSAWVFIIQDEQFMYVNPAAEAGMGYSLKEWAKLPPILLVHPADQQLVQARMEARRHGIPLLANYELRVLTKTGEERWVQVSTGPIEYCGAQAILGTAFDITDRKQAEEQLKISAQQLHQLAGYLQTIREEERTTMAREIHDELGQALTAMKIDLVRLSGVVSASAAPAQERLNGLVELINATINTVRKLASQLRPGVLDDLGLAAALEWQAQEFQTRTGIACEFVELSEAANLGTEQATAIFRICQEALTNVARHAQATRVTICLQETPTHLRLEVKDNGRGVTAGELTNPRSLGLLGMRERAFLLGGECHLTGAVNAGTTVTVQIPLQQTKAHRGVL